MLKIIPDIQKTATLVQEIAAASSEQNSGVSQIAKAIEQLSQITQENSAAAEEMSSTSEELASQAASLHDAIMFFNTGKTEKIDIKRTTLINKRFAVNQKLASTNKSSKIIESDLHDHDFEAF